MTIQTIELRHSTATFSKYDMDPNGDKEERKREYNRLAQREFRRRRKEHLKNLEQAQKEQSSEQSEEIERLRHQNAELKRENESLRAQMYPSSISGLLSNPISIPNHHPHHHHDSRAYSVSPSISGQSISGAGSPPATMGSDMMPITSLSFSTSMLPPTTIPAYSDATSLAPVPTQPYSMVLPPGSIRQNSQSSQGSSSEFGSPRTSVGSAFQSLNITQAVEAQAYPSGAFKQYKGSAPNLMVMVPYDRNKARAELISTFSALISNPAMLASATSHLETLRKMADTLPLPLKPNKAQLSTPHYYAIDMIASPSLRDRLMNVSTDVAQSFISELGICKGPSEDIGQVIIWGEDPLNEMAWELSHPILERWGWLLGPEWTLRANFWRRQRGAHLLPEW